MKIECESDVRPARSADAGSVMKLFSFAPKMVAAL